MEIHFTFTLLHLESGRNWKDQIRLIHRLTFNISCTEATKKIDLWEYIINIFTAGYSYHFHILPWIETDPIISDTKPVFPFKYNYLPFLGNNSDSPKRMARIHGI